TPRLRRLGGDAGPAPGGEWWARLRLTPAQAARLAGEVRGLLNRYRKEAGEDGAEHLIHFALARRPLP
ncbi:MAG: hypothetical protein JOZ27_04535, partial [Caulobacteraceae bacterium]|nr:hypothetical protein [Caulobacteraceae bacterium]